MEGVFEHKRQPSHIETELDNLNSNHAIATYDNKNKKDNMKKVPNRRHLDIDNGQWEEGTFDNIA